MKLEDRGLETLRAGAPFAPGHVPLWGAALFSLLLTTVIGLFLGTASYARQETISGTLTPSAGVSAIIPLQAGVINAVLVTEGDAVPVGVPLVAISVDAELSDGPAVAVRSLDAIEAQGRAIDRQREAGDALAAARLSDLRARREALTERLSFLRQSAALARERVETSQSLLERAGPAHQAGYIADVRMQQWLNDLIQARLSLTSAEQAVVDAEGTGEQLRAEVLRIEAETRSETERLTVQSAQTRERAAATEAGRQVVLRSPIAGRISMLRARPGAAVAAGETLAVLSPPGSRLQAELWAPSRSIGFLQPGDPVKLMYEAFPYQKFGMAQGRVVAVAGAPLPAEAGGEPLYRVVVNLERQDQTAFGRSWPLATGMRVSGIVVLERRSALMWLLEPVLALRARGS